MDDAIQVLVFVVTFIIFIVSAVMKQKKKANTKNNNFGNVIESIFGLSVEAPPEPQEDAFVDDIKIDEVGVTSNPNQESFVNEGVNAIPDKVNENYNDFESEEELEESSFDLRKAVIYTEILNRKTF
jgi:hypothetical protein